MHHILAHSPTFDHVHFITQFLDGLKGEIRTVVMLCQPSDLDSTFSLSVLQEELLDALPWREYRRPARTIRASLLRFLCWALVHAALAAAEDHRTLDIAHVPDRRKHARGEDRVASLCNYRRAHRLCFKCG